MTQPITSIPRSTARLQFHSGFTLDDAIPVVPYLASLGISHLYASPILQARAGSTHGYDTTDHRHVNPELGGEPALRRLVAALRQHGMGLLLDIVPNHMGVGGDDNPVWLDVMAHGPEGRYAQFFDIDWQSDDPELRGKMLAPFLGRPYGEALTEGELKLVRKGPTGLAVDYFDNLFPIRPEDVEATLADLESFDPSSESGRARLHELLERQHFRLAHWKLASEEINWRRFFDVTSLAGVRAEVPEVFDETHEVILRLYAEGLIDGLRIDHVDGLSQPGAYCRKLRRRMAAAARHRPPEAPRVEPCIVVEKILAPGEALPADWKVDGTTGYDFMDQVSALLHDPAGEATLSQLWRDVSGSGRDFPAEERLARRQILRDNLAAEREACARALHRIARAGIMTRDVPLATIRRVLTEILVHFPVYRIYARASRPTSQDATVMLRAIGAARANLPLSDHPVLELLHLWLAEEPLRHLPPEQRRLRLVARTRFQQLSSPTAAKSVEDTAFYRYGRLLSRNEVGSHPGQFSLPPNSFHAACHRRLEQHPGALLATATHDHKRGEDVRMRLAALSEIADEWAATLRGWMGASTPLRRLLESGPAPEDGDAAMLFQMLAASWPLDLNPEDRAGIEDWIGRLAGWQQKAIREEKRRSSWSMPDEEYEAASRTFLEGVLDITTSPQLLRGIAGFAERIAPAAAVKGLAQVALRLTAPGVPDLYQGTEYWDESLVDPDNRRPVDFGARMASLHTDASPAALLPQWRDGRVKQAVIHRLLRLRAEWPELFHHGSYKPLEAVGPRADSVLAFLREHEGRQLLMAVPLRSATLLGGAGTPAFPKGSWAGTWLPLMRAGEQWHCVFSGRRVDAGESLGLESWEEELPLLVLRRGA
ncbi:malto-oligosyltrehalose synthase [Roseomonas marmotae]|uniref:Malto-oligosyltrehalose synthase n=1 Tax=Roseomonas marmotae TaxID=2768161 RepID=A0ABS3K8U7_9PROT|nr:malto-oligosyltrehalose synthase [Roseomonas marmotae]MBO1073883.1 malto-oligosyltrehalose synthase [Roseomonas marmotae]QTI78495.1 malto-oligosyltrehalose synthase [Roseomonas marmotae]